MMNNIRKITRKELLNEVAGISFIVRKWAKILEDEVRGDQADTDEDEEVVTHYMDLQDNTITTREQIHNEAHFFEGLEPYQNLPGIGS